MMTDDIAAYLARNALGILAIAGAAWSAYTAHKALRLSQASTDPAITVDHHPGNPDGWHRISLSVTNRADYAIRLDDIVIRRPWRGRLLNTRDIEKVDAGVGKAPIERYPMQKAARSVALNMEVQPAGTTSDFAWAGDHRWLEVLVWARPSGRPTRASLRLRISTMETVSRRKVIPIKRLLRTTASKATD